MFGLSFPELCVLLIVSMVVLGPKELPRYLRKAGQMAARLRRLATEMREKSGIDEVLRTEGLDREIAEFRRLARGEILGVTSAVRSVASAARLDEPGRTAYAASVAPQLIVPNDTPSAAYGTGDQGPDDGASEREYPREGPDSYGALPDQASVYDGQLAASPLAEDSLYAHGKPSTEAAVPPTAPTPTEASATTA